MSITLLTPLSGLPAAATLIKETVADHDALLLLTLADVQNGDVVEVTADTDGNLRNYRVIDDSQLSEDGVTPGAEAAFAAMAYDSVARAAAAAAQDTADAPATVSTQGRVQLASQPRTNQLRDSDFAVTPASLRDINVESLSGDKTLIASDAHRQYLDPNGADRVVTMPVIAAEPLSGQEVGYGHLFEITNPGPADSLVIKDASGAQLTRLDPLESAQLVATATGWTLVKAPQNAPFILTFPAIDIADGAAGDDVTIYTPLAGLRGILIDAQWITDTTSGTITTQGQVTLMAGADAITSALALGTTPVVDARKLFTLADGPAFSAANPLILDKTVLAVGTNPVHRGTLIVTIALI